MKTFGHRGWPQRYAENSIEGMIAAVNAGAHGIELDVRLSSDNQCVVFHDDNTLRMTGKDIALSSLRLDQLSELSIDSPSNSHSAKIPTLAEVIAALPTDTPLNIELKTLPAYLVEELASQLTGLLDNSQQRNVLLSSFDLAIIEKAYQELPYIPRAIAFEADDLVDIATLRALACNTASLHYSLISSTLINALKDEGISSTVWTVNSQTQYDYCKQLGVDSVISDCLIGIT